MQKIAIKQFWNIIPQLSVECKISMEDEGEQ